MKRFLIILCSAIILFCGQIEADAYTMVLQPGSGDGIDAYIATRHDSGWVYDGRFNENDPYMIVSEAPLDGDLETRGLLKFELPNILYSDNIVINNATISLYKYASFIFNRPHNGLYMDRVTSDWSEKYVTWANRPNTDQAYQVQTGQLVYEGTAWIDFNCTELVNYWQGNADYNFGVEIYLEPGYPFDQVVDHRGITFYTSEYENSERWPKLTIDYDVVPEPATLSLLGLGLLGLVFKKKKIT